VLHLTKGEEKLFRALPDDVLNGWQVTEETLTYADTAQKQSIRLSMLRVRDPKLVAFREAAAQCKSTAEFVKLLAESDLRGIGAEDIAHLFYAVGPHVLSAFVLALLSEAKNDKDIARVADIAAARHLLLTSLQPR
jgi:hypothetical protein